MKKYLFILFALVVAVSCNDEKFLEEHSYTDDTGSFFQSQSSMEIALASAYSNIQYMVFGNQRGGSEHNWMLNGMGLDSFGQTGSNSQFSNWSLLTSDSGYARHYGDYMYKLANRANTVVDMIDEHPEIEYNPAEMKTILRAEAVFLRAWAYRVLAGMFGQLVYSEHMTQEARYDYVMIPREEGWEKIAEDFKYAEENLPAKPRKMGTVTKAAAAHYLAETQVTAPTRLRTATATPSPPLRVPTGICSVPPPRPTSVPTPLIPTRTIRVTRKPSGLPRSTLIPALTAGRSVPPVTPGSVCTFPSLNPPGLPGSRWVARTVPVPTRMARSSTSSRPMLPAILPV